MKSGLIVITILLFPLFLFNSCFMQCLDGSGVVITEERPVEAIHSIMLEGPGKVILHKGGKETLSLKADENLLPLIETKVSAGVLTISTTKCIGKFSAYEINIGIEELKSIENSGSGSIRGLDSFKGEVIKLKQSGSGDINVEIKAKTLVVRQSGSGEISLSGNADEQNIEVSGSGDYDATQFKTSKSKAEVTGSGSCDIWVEKELDALVSGSGDIRYKGSPKQVNSKVTGSGAIKQRED
jgi:hypothetical protein